MDASGIRAWRLNAKEVLTPQNGGSLKFPIADGTATLSGEEIRFWEHLPTFTWDNPDWGEEQGKSSTRIRRVFFNPISRLIAGWWWSKKWLLVHFRELHLPSSRWTESQTVHSERRIIPNSTTIRWRDQSNKYDLGCDAWAPHRRLLEHRRRPRPIRFVAWILHDSQ